MIIIYKSVDCIIHLAFNRTGGQPLDDLLVEYQIDDKRWKDRNSGPRESWPPIDLAILAYEIQQTSLNGTQVIAADEGQGEEQVVPQEKEIHQADSDESICDHRDGHLKEYLVDACAIEHRCLDDGARNVFEETRHQKHRKRKRGA